MPDAADNQGFQPVASQPTTPPVPPYQPVAAPPPKQGSSALKIVLIIVAIFIGLGIVGVGVVGYVGYKVAKAVKMSSSTPVTESDLGVAIYPGAVQGKGALHMTLAGKSMVTANFLTTDSKDQVMAFYQNNMGPAAQSTTTASGGTLILTKGSGETVTVTVAQNPNLHQGKTQIVIVHASNAASN